MSQDTSAWHSKSIMTESTKLPMSSNLSRQSSLSRSTKASDARSVRSIEISPPTSSHSRQPSLRQHVLGASSASTRQTQDSSSLETQRRTHLTPQSHSSLRPRTMATSTSVNGLAGMSTEYGGKNMPGLYLGGTKSSSSRNLSNHLSPRRAGLGARTISPVEIQRSKRNSRLLAIDTEKTTPAYAGLSKSSSIRNFSGIPSPVKHPPMSRTRPSPVPPVPPIPDRVAGSARRRLTPSKHDEGFRTISDTTSRQRSATVGPSKEALTRVARMADESSSFTSPVKQIKKPLPAANEASAGQLQSLTLPPLKVHGLSTPTARRVHDMSQRLQSIDLSTERSAVAFRQQSSDLATSSRTSRTPTTTFSSSSNASTSLHQKGSLGGQSTDELPPDLALHHSVFDVTTASSSATTAIKARDSGNFFNRLSLSRSSSRSKAKARKQSTEIPTDQSFDSIEQVGMDRSRRRLSLSWVKGKMSPFGGSSSSVPKIDPGTPPMIPKSYTSESLSSQLNNNEATIVEKAIGVTMAPDARGDTQSDGPHDFGPLSTIVGLTATEIADDEMRRLVITRKGSGYLEKAQAQVGALEAQAVIRRPVEADNVSSLDGSTLNLYEKGEVIDYDGSIYFTGQRGLVKLGGRLDLANSINFGYDDDRGDYLINPGDHFAYRYEIIDVLGKGSFGQVLRCIDYKTGSLVAVKVIRNKKRFHAQALVEVNILQRLRSWDPEDQHHLIKYTDHFYFRHHLCIATDLLGINLYEFVKANDFKGCTLNMIRSFASQILSCLNLLKKQRVIHCDLKPENILLVNIWESRIKIIDFGSSCFEDQKVYTYIQSRFYRSPEVILGLTYGLPIDMWSMGCILAELFTGYPIFPGEDEQEQLACIMEIFGPPEKHLIENSTRKKLFFDSFGKPRNAVSSKGKRRKPCSKTLSQAIKCQDEAFLDFMTQCLRWNPANRLTPEQALEHPFITGRSMKFAETPLRLSKKLVHNHLTSLTPRPLPQIPRTPAGQTARLRSGYAAYRSSSTAVTGNPPTLGSPNKARRAVSNLPVPRERLIT